MTSITKPHLLNRVAPLLLCLFASACASSSGEEELGRTQEKVIGGAPASLGEWPWQAQLAVTGYSHWCGGSLLNEEWVLTAAHCAEGMSAGDFTVRLGAHQRSAPDGFVQTRSVSEVHLHPDYDPWTLDSDVALLRLSTPATFNHRVQPIAIRATDPPIDAPAFVSGWGNDAPGSGSVDVLQEALLPVRSTATCNAAGTLPLTVGANMVCAGFVGGDSGGCHGDSGGPLVLPGAFSGGWELVGVVSWGRGYYCNTYTVFARLSTLRGWINGIAGGSDVFGDVNGSGCVDQADYDFVGANFGTPPAVSAAADLNKDGVVNYADVALVVQNWGEGC